MAKRFEEVWRPVVTHPNTYEISNHFRVRRIETGNILLDSHDFIHPDLVWYNLTKPKRCVYAKTLYLESFHGVEPKVPIKRQSIKKDVGVKVAAMYFSGKFLKKTIAEVCGVPMTSVKTIAKKHEKFLKKSDLMAV